MVVHDSLSSPSATLAQVTAFLADPRSHGGHPEVTLIETHMSLVFLAGDRVYKMKKPVRLPFADYSSLEARRINCEREAALNQELAPGIYLGTLPLFRGTDGGIGWRGQGEPIEWLVVMRRLDPQGLVDFAAQHGRLQRADIDRLGALLVRFYARTKRIGVPPAEIGRWWDSNLRLLEASLADPVFGLDATVDRVLAGLRNALDRSEALLAERLAQGCIVDGHGDLRPEHVHLGPPVVVIDRLEFDARLRWADPYDEVAFFGLECRRLGAPWVEAYLAEALRVALPPPPGRLLAFYRCYRAALRARLSIEHLRDPQPRTPKRWRPQAESYLKLALEALPGLQS